MTKDRRERALDALIFGLLIFASIIAVGASATGFVGLVNSARVTTQQNMTVIAAYTQPHCVIWCAGTEYHLIVGNQTSGIVPMDITTDAAIYFTHPVGSTYNSITTQTVVDPIAMLLLILGLIGVYTLLRFWWHSIISEE